MRLRRIDVIYLSCLIKATIYGELIACNMPEKCHAQTPINISLAHSTWVCPVYSGTSGTFDALKFQLVETIIMYFHRCKRGITAMIIIDLFLLFSILSKSHYQLYSKYIY